MARPTDSRPLLHDPNISTSDIDRGRPGYRPPRRLSADSHVPPSLLAPAGQERLAPQAMLSRQGSFRSRSPSSNARLAARQKYTYAAFFLVLSLISFTVQTELAAWVQHAGWNKAYCMLYMTHGSWSILWPVQLFILRLQKRSVPWPSFWRRHIWLLRTTAEMVETRDLDAHTISHRHGGDAGGLFSGGGHVAYMVRTTAFVTCSLTVAGLSWYIAVALTTPSDLTAIYNCSAFFAYAFSVPLLKERLRLDKTAAVIVAVVGVLVVAYGDGKESSPANSESGDVGGDAGKRLLGNLVIGVGSVLYGLYEVLYKRYACPPDGCSPGRGMIFANTFGSCIGLFTLTILWIPLPILHLAGIETFVIPTGKVAWYLFLSVVMNAIFAGSFLVLISLTSPVLSSVASLLTIFIVAASDWLLTGQPPSIPAIVGGGMIVVAFVMLSWSTYKEMTEEERKKEADLSGDEDANSSDDEDSGLMHG